MNITNQHAFYSWGRYPQVQQKVLIPKSITELNFQENGFFLAYGNGRSYGDVCLNQGGSLIHTKFLDKFIAFDQENLLLTTEAGVLFSEILNVIVPKGYFLPVTPGTKFITVGGAVANDVHGKNHHLAGSFGNHITRFSILRSDGVIYQCSPKENSKLFYATIGGLGLTGLILDVTFKIIPIASTFIDQEVIKFCNLEEFFELSKNSTTKYDYTVAWIDCLQSGKALGRGHFIQGNHAKSNLGFSTKKNKTLSLPLFAPSFVLNPFTVRVFNELYYQRQFSKIKKTFTHYEPFFYPLDSILHWNRLYGKRGFTQFQAVLPLVDKEVVVKELLKISAESKMASFLAVLKEFGTVASLGMLSFPRSGVTICMDFPIVADKTKKLLKKLEDITVSAKGTIYPAKDAWLSAKNFNIMFPNFGEFSKYIDSKFSSSFLRRVSG